MTRCSLITRVTRPLPARPFGREARWIVRMACGAVHDTNAVEPPVSVPCAHTATCTAAAPQPPRKVRPPAGLVRQCPTTSPG